MHRPERIEGLQVLRGVAAMLVVYNHAAWAVIDGQRHFDFSWLVRSPKLAEIGEIGVDLFFVISGFVMTLSARRFTGVHGALSFFAQRANRIAPLYYLISLVLLAELLRAGEIASIERESLLNSLTFIPVFDDGTYSWPIHFLGWTLAFEFIFYTFVAVQIAVGLSARPFVLLFVMAVLPLLHGLTSGAPIVWRMATNPLLWEFGLGIFCYLLWAKGLLARIPRVWFAMVALIAAAAVAMQLAGDAPELVFLAGDPVSSDSTARVLHFGLPSFVIVSFVVGLRVGDGSISRIGRTLGDASYSIYLTHLLVIASMARLAEGISLRVDLFLAAAIIVSAMVGVLSYRLVEKPMLEAGQRRMRGWLSAKAVDPLVAMPAPRRGGSNRLR